MGAEYSIPPPQCPNGHEMVSTSDDSGDYASGFVCDVCKKSSGNDDYTGCLFKRWNCSECTYDICNICTPEYALSSEKSAEVESKLRNLNEDNVNELIDVIQNNDDAKNFLQQQHDVLNRLAAFSRTCTSQLRPRVTRALEIFSLGPDCGIAISKNPYVFATLADLLNEETDPGLSDLPHWVADVSDPAISFISYLVRVINEAPDRQVECALGIASCISDELSGKYLFVEPSNGMLNALVAVIRRDAGTLRSTASQVVMNLSTTEEGSSKIMATEVYRDLLDIIRNSPSDPAEWGDSNEKPYSNTCIMNLAELEVNRPILKAAGAVEILGPLLKFNHFHSLTASMTYAFLVGRDEKGPQVEVLQSGVVVIDRLIDLVENTLNREGGDGYQYGLFRLEVVVHACLELSLSDANKRKLAVSRVRDLLKAVILLALPGGRGADQYNSEKELLKAAGVAIEGLLQLSFVYEDSDELIKEGTGLYPPSSGVKEAVSAYVDFTKIELAGTFAGLLLSRLTPKAAVPKTTTADVKDSFGKTVKRQHIMISYCWAKNAKPQLVEALAKSLRAKGFEVWRDVEGSDYVPPMSGSTDERMAEAIEFSYAVVICVSKEYKQSPNCRMEANYTNQRFKKGKIKVIYVMMQSEYTTVSDPESVDGYLAIMIGDSLWYPLWDESRLGDTANEVAKMVGNEARHIDGYVRTFQSAAVDTNGPEPSLDSAVMPSYGGGVSDARIVALEARLSSLEEKVDSKVDALISLMNSHFSRLEKKLDNSLSNKHS